MGYCLLMTFFACIPKAGKRISRRYLIGYAPIKWATTPFNDHGLRPLIADICASNLDELLGMGFTNGPPMEQKAMWAYSIPKPASS